MITLLILFLGAIATLFTGIFAQRKHIQPLAVGVLGLAFISAIYTLAQSDFAGKYSTMFVFDAMALEFSCLAIGATLLLVSLSGRSLQGVHDALAEHYALMLFVLCGLLCMVSFENLTMLFLGIEILSIPLYVLAGSRKTDLHSNESALKYFIMGAFATGFLLMGIALVYGATGSFDTQTIANYIAQNPTPNYLLNIGILMLVVALCFKVGAVPFHFWSPDVYQGAPTLITAFMATVVKIAAFGAFLRLFTDAFVGLVGWYGGIIAVIAAITMLVANAIALQQNSVKRMLAYSSVSHAGYLLMVLVVAGDANSSATPVVNMLVYLGAYTAATVCVFALYLGVAGNSDFATADSFNGLAQRKPVAAAAGSIAMLSLAGIPPTAGFFGKYLVFSQVFVAYPWLVCVAIVGSAMSMVYYLRLIIAMYFKDATEPELADSNTSPIYQLVMIICVVLVFLMAFLPNVL